MSNVRYGFIVFEKCAETEEVRSYFADDETWDEYREDGRQWSIIENAQTIRFDLACEDCGHVEPFDDLMGLLYCTECLDDCPVARLQRELEAEKTWLMVAFGFLPRGAEEYPASKLEALTAYFNQRRDITRSRIRFVPYDWIKRFADCKGEFIHDVGMLSLEPQDRKPLLGAE
jgi:hypothetical protein